MSQNQNQVSETDARLSNVLKTLEDAVKIRENKIENLLKEYEGHLAEARGLRIGVAAVKEQIGLMSNVR